MAWSSRIEFKKKSWQNDITHVELNSGGLQEYTAMEDTGSNTHLPSLSNGSGSAFSTISLSELAKPMLS